jgi:hypothetical protein
MKVMNGSLRAGLEAVVGQQATEYTSRELLAAVAC